MVQRPDRFVIRRANAADAQTLAEISRTTFTETFGHLYAPEDLAQHLNGTYPPQTYADALQEQGCAAWLLEDGAHEAQGYAYAGPCTLPHADVRMGDLELKRLYVRKQVQNGGWGARLFEEALRWMQANGPHALWIGVFSQNTGAQRFYGRYGFKKAGEYFYSVGQARDLEFIFLRVEE